VYVPLPTSLHVRWATAAAARGKYLLLEKPTALCNADLDAILAACDAAGVQFMDCTIWMHHPRTAKMREFVERTPSATSNWLVFWNNAFARIR
jgi:predicted dehydrogenase